MTELQTIMLRRLRLEFAVDTTPAEGLEGVDLDAWLYQAEDELFERLVAKEPAPRKNIGMAMIPPYTVYADGVPVATYATEEEAEDHYARLRVSHLGKREAIGHPAGK